LPVAVGRKKKRRLGKGAKGARTKKKGKKKKGQYFASKNQKSRGTDRKEIDMLQNGHSRGVS